MPEKRPTNRRTGGPTLAFLAGYRSYKNGWGFKLSPNYTTDQYWDFVQGFEMALAEAKL